uniref:Phosphoenolpyruvate carboxykinase (GTP) n=1 Tax=Angiostrongylus cantonensis TaxID=6313 RepID=A0A0K0DL70_ANGCA
MVYITVFNIVLTLHGHVRPNLIKVGAVLNKTLSDCELDAEFSQVFSPDITSICWNLDDIKLMPGQNSLSNSSTTISVEKLSDVTMALAVSASEQRRDRTTSCDYCAHPFEACQKIRICASPYVYKTDFIVEGYGSVPVTNGDPKWLPTRVEAFIAAQVKLMKPAEIHICNGSWSEADYLASVLERKGMLERLGAHDNVFVARTDPRDAMERRTFIVTKNSEEVQKKYVIPFAMGPIGGRYSINAVQLTDSPFVVLNMRLLTRVSSSIWDAIGNADFVRCVHSIGRPRPVTVVNKYNIWSFGSSFGENAFLGTKSLGLRLASYRGWKEGWLAMNAALIAIKGPSGKEVFGCVALPKGVGKTEIATMTPTLQGWQVQLLGDDIAWIRCGPNGKLYASAPANGLFACPDDASPDKNENIFKMLSKNAILVNCATTSKGRFHWEALEKFLEDDEKVTDWKRQEWTPEQKRSPAHMNCHYTVLTSSAPNVHPSWELSTGVPLSFHNFTA